MQILKNALIKFFVLIIILLIVFFIILSFNSFHILKLPALVSTSIELKQEIKILPFPHIKFTQITPPNKPSSILVNNIRAYFSFESLLKFDPQITRVEIDKVDIFDNNLNFAEYRDLTFFLKLMDIYQQNFNNVNFHIINVGIYSQNTKRNNSVQIKHINDCKIEPKKITFTSNNNLINLTFNDNAILTGNIKSDGYEFKSQSSYSKNIILNSKFDLKITNLARFFSKIFLTEHPNVSWFKNQPNLSEPIVASWNNRVDENNSSILENIIINSPIVKLKASGLSNSQNLSAFNIDIETLNLSSILNNLSLSNTQSSELVKIFINKISNNNLNIKAKEIILTNDKIKDFQLISACKSDGTYVLQDARGIFASGGNFAINGTNTENIDYGRFNGKLALIHNNAEELSRSLGFNNYTDFTPATQAEFYSDILLKDYEINLSNISLKLNNDTNITGSFAFRTSNPENYIKSDLKFGPIDLTSDKYQKINNNFIKLLSKYIPYKNTGNYLDQLSNLRKLQYMMDNQWYFEQLKLVNTTVSDFILAWAIKEGTISLYNFNGMINDSKLFGTMLFDSNSIVPSLLANIKSTKLDLTNLINAEEFISTISSIQNNVALDKLTLDLTTKIDKVVIDKKEFTELNLKTTTKQNTISVDELSAKQLNSTFGINGNIYSNPLSMNIAFSYNGLSAKDLANYSYSIINFSDGLFSIAGLLETKGSKLNELFYNSKLELDFLASNLVYNNSGIDGFIALISDPNYQVNKFKSDIAMRLFYGTTNISSANGKLLLDKGIFTLNSAVFNTERTATIAAGHLNIYDESLNLSVLSKFYLADGSNNSDNKNNNPSATGINTIQVDLSNTLSNIVQKVDSEALYDKLLARSTANAPAAPVANTPATP
ncbi:MAG: hypothetical protein K9G11_02880 [Rickettsiaceae bacterium]|nr:hypothetical protein [Rickettsiaceae bacterium]